MNFSARQRVYFLGAIGGPIKIGYSADLRIRRNSLQVGNHRQVGILASIPGGHDQEAFLKSKFAAAKLRGEWFRPVPELLALLWDAAENPDLYIGLGEALSPECHLLRRFLDDRTCRAANERCRSGQLHAAFAEWCRGVGEEAWSLRAFAARMAALGYLKIRSNGIWWIGLNLNPEAGTPFQSATSERPL